MNIQSDPAAGRMIATPGKPSRAARRKKMSPQRQQFYKAIAMSDADLGAAVKDPTERIGKHLGSAFAHETEAKKEREQAQREFRENIAYYYEAKQRLLNPGYRTDANGGRERTPTENEKNFGAPDWAGYARKCVAYSLQHADRLLKAFAKANDLLTDEGENIDDPGTDGNQEERRPRGRRTGDPTTLKRYEFIAAAAIAIANRNPDGEVEKQILAAAEHTPAPVMPLSAGLFSEVLSFLTDISARVTDSNVRAEARQLVAKMRLHQPELKAPELPPAVAAEEKRKRNKRLEKKNRQPLREPTGSTGAGGTSEHVQRSGPAGEVKEGGNALPQPEHCRTAKPAAPAAPSTVQADAVPAGQQRTQSAGTGMPKRERAAKAQKHPAAAKVTVCPAVLSPDDEERMQARLNAAPAQPGVRQGDYVFNEQGKWEFDPDGRPVDLDGRASATAA